MLVVAVAVILLPIFFISLKKLGFFGSSSTEKLPPGPNALQLLRKVSEFRNKPHIAITTLAKLYGPIMSFHLGTQVVIIASSSSAAKQIFKTHDQNFSGRYLTSVFCKLPTIEHCSLAMSRECNATWKLLRDVTQNVIFSSKSVHSKACTRKAKVAEMVEYIRSKAGETVDLEDLMNSTIYNIISDVLVSRNLVDITREDEGDGKVRAVVREIIDLVSSSVGLSDLFPVLRKLNLPSTKRKAMEIHGKIMYIWEDIVKERRSEKRDRGLVDANSGGDFLDVMIENGFPDDQICNVTMELLAAGMDTSGITSVWLMVELIKNPHILRRVRDEIASAFEGDDHTLIDESVLSDSHYFQACIKETLRLHIPGPLLMPRRAIETCKIDDYVIPKDSVVLVNAWAISMDPDTWKDATSFNPDRFLESKIDFRGNHFEYIPFGSGRRMCPGFNLALKDIQIVVASLVHYFDWSLPNGMDPTQIDMADKFGTVLKKETPLLLIPSLKKY
ncbi:hypothetical protein ABFX02_06G037100 [Erythranthe guttata]